MNIGAVARKSAGVRSVKGGRRCGTTMVWQVRTSRRQPLRCDGIDAHESRDRHFRRSSFVQVPTLVLHLTDDTLVSVEGGRELAAGIPNARLVEFPGTDHIAFLDAGDKIVAEIEEFLTGSRSTPSSTGSSQLSSSPTSLIQPCAPDVKGDVAWRDLLNAHDKTVRQELSRFRGKEVKSSVTVSWPPSTVRRARSTALVPFVTRCTGLARSGAHRRAYGRGRTGGG